MKEWFLALSSRERNLVVAGTAAIFAVLVYLFWLEPLHQRLASARLEAAAQRDLETLVARAAQARASGSLGDGPRDQRSLLALIDASSREAGVAQAVRRIQPADADSVQVRLDAVPFDRAIAWVVDLDQRPGLAIAELTARKNGPGTADISFRLSRH
ncbi:MAG: type II secretion system protein GspM [Pseudomonadota bacterium]|nr:type II secretion system protein GspM [Pseudomonadota bacterium]